MELQKMQDEKNTNLSYHVFQILETEKKSEYGKCQKNIEELKYNVDILKEFGGLKSKVVPRKIIVRKKTRTNTKRRTRIYRNYSLNNGDIENSNKSLDKLIKKNYYIINNKNQKSLNNKREKNENKRPITQNIIIPNKEENLNQDTSKNENEIFITNFRMSTGNGEEPSNNLVNRYSQYIKNTERYKLNNKIYSLKKYLPPIKTKSSLTNKINSNNLRSNTLNNLNEKYSYLNNLINEDSKTLNDKKLDNFFSYVQTDNSRSGSKHLKLLKINENIALKMIKNNKRIIKNIKHVKNNLEEANIEFESKFKYINWKYGIADMNKYFIDLQAYKKSEEELINKRKSFYDRLDDVIEDIKKVQKSKNLDNIAKQFGINLKEDVKNKEIEESDKMFFKNREVKNSLKELYKRQKVEKEKREKIKQILSRCKDKFNSIWMKLDEYKIKEKKLKEV